MSFAELIKNKGKNLKKNDEGILVRTKEGLLFREKIVDGVMIREEVGQKEFIPIEAAPDPEVCKIDEYLFLGSQDAAVNVDLKKNNVTHILNVATGIANQFPQEYTYLNIEILDVDEAPIIDQFAKCFSFIDNAITNKNGVLIHCNAGVSRSATVTIAYLMYKKRISFKEAHEQVLKCRPKVRPNAGFIQQLKKYELQVLNDA